MTINKVLIFFISLSVLIGCKSKFENIVISNSLSDTILFRGIDNQIQLNGLANPEKYILVDSIGTKNLFLDSCNCFLLSGEQESYSLVEIKSNKFIRNISFRNLEVPFPGLTVLGKIQGTDEIELDSLSTISRIDIEGFLNIQGYEILEFRLVTVGNGGIHYERSDSNRLTQSMKDKLNSLQRGEMFSFESILVRFTNGEIKEVSPFILRTV